jgi:dUTP pyrophosphatase
VTHNAELTLKVRRLSPNAQLPARAHAADAGLDLFAAEAAVLLPGESRLVKTGIAIELPPRTEAQIRPRSGLALKHQVTVLNTPGTVDEGYRGEVGVILINHGSAAFEVAVGARIAQLVVKPVLAVGVIEVADLTATDRGGGGFGSTG